jgi:hypothetical protein
MRFSEHFKLGKEQAELDFVDVDPGKDLELYVDPYAIEIRNDDWSAECGDHIRSFFQAVLDALRTGQVRKAEHLVSHLSEPNETCLGVSSGKPRGRGVGSFQGEQILEALRKSVAFKSGLLSDLAEAELFIEGIGRDKISDLTTNIIRGPLLRYTKEQCDLHGVRTKRVATAAAWQPSRSQWESGYASLPVVNGKPILLVPKFSVRQRLSLESQEFYNHHMVEFLRSEYQDSASGLVHVLKSGRRRVLKKDVKERHPFIKDDLAKFVTEHPEVLVAYKKIKGAQGALSGEDLEKDFDERVLARALKARLAEIEPGSEAAHSYHSLMTGILTFVFYPELICPIKERELHEGRKRVDILFTNAAREGFFFRMQVSAQTRSSHVFVECKNYSDEVGNPELDQLGGRFGHQRGFLGILLCRQVARRDVTRARCRDTAQDGRGYIIVLSDDDVNALLDLIAAGRRDQISGFMQRKYDELVL